MKKIIFMALAIPTIAQSTTLSELDAKINLLNQEIENIKSDRSSAAERFSIGGYGEISYTNQAGRDQSDRRVTGGEAKADTLRNVLVMGYQFDPKWKLVSEIEIEHANEIYSEFLYLEYNHNALLNFQAGLIPAPIGILNLTHEPPTFYSVNRTEVETNMIPTTWREIGAGVSGKWESIRYGAYIINSLKGSEFTSSSVRKARQKGSSSLADKQSYVANINWTVASGLDLGGSAYFGTLNNAKSASHSIYEVHGEWKYKGLRVRGLFAKAFIDAKELNELKGLSGSSSIGEEQVGSYLEAGYDLLNRGKDALIVFARYETLNMQSKVPTGYSANKANDKQNITFGLNYRPIDQIVFKADYIVARNEAKSGADSFNLGIGWNF